MIEGGRRDAGAFGKRGAAVRHEASLPDALPDGQGPSAPVRGPLSWALRTAALVGLGSFLAAQVLVRQGVPGADPAPRLAEGRRVAGFDPETTGAIGPAVGDPSSADARCGPLIACLRAPPTHPRP